MATTLPRTPAAGHSRPVTESPPSTDAAAAAHPLALLAHELRTPLTALIGYAEAMRDAAFGPVNPPYDAHAATMTKAARHLLALVDDLTTIAKADSGIWTRAPDQVDLAMLGREVLDLLAPRAAVADVTLRLESAGAVGELSADRRGLTQILLNLLDNALKHTGGGGTITLSLSQSVETLFIVVSDTGRQAEAPVTGEGIGLRLVRALCAAQGGTMTLTHLPEGGARAELVLPVNLEG